MASIAETLRNTFSFLFTRTRKEKLLAEYEAPPLDPAVDEALLDFMNRRKAAAPDSNV